MKPNRFTTIEIPKYVVEESALFSGPSNSYEKLLEVSKEFEDADMTPIFLYDKHLKIMFCVAKETYEKKLH